MYDNFTYISLTQYSFATTVSELTRGTTTASSGKGHVKSASVSSPGPSAADSNSSAQPSDALGQRYKMSPTTTSNSVYTLRHYQPTLWTGTSLPPPFMSTVKYSQNNKNKEKEQFTRDYSNQKNFWFFFTFASNNKFYWFSACFVVLSKLRLVISSVQF